MTHGSLYSGIGGWLLAAQWAGIENVFTCEIEDFPNKVLDKHFPDTDRHYDIKETDFTKYAGRIDILSTSDPCQPFSFAGKRGGTTDDRFLWPFTIEAIRTIKPSYVVFENVPGFVGMALETISSDLEESGYRVESFIIPAASLNAPHYRDRLWVIAYPDRKNNNFDVVNSRTTIKWKQDEEIGGSYWGQYILDNGFMAPEKWRKTRQQTDARPLFFRDDDGVSTTLDRLKSLGNAIVPQIAFLIFEAIKNAEAHQNIP